MVQNLDDKRFFRMAEASRIVGVKPHVLRYWETEFPQIKPRRADSNQRTYQKEDLMAILEIKRLLHEERMTVEGAKRRLARERKEATVQDKHMFLKNIKTELLQIMEILTQ